MSRKLFAVRIDLQVMFVLIRVLFAVRIDKNPFMYLLGFESISIIIFKV